MKGKAMIIGKLLPLISHKENNNVLRRLKPITRNKNKNPVFDAAEVLDIISCYSKISHKAHTLLNNTTMNFWISLLPYNPQDFHKRNYTNTTLHSLLLSLLVPLDC